jgi:hypothetical protein
MVEPSIIHNKNIDIVLACCVTIKFYEALAKPTLYRCTEWTVGIDERRLKSSEMYFIRQKITYFSAIKETGPYEF